MLQKETKENIIKKYGLHEKDTGSAEVQIALLTERINILSEHLNTHKKDFHSRWGLLKMIGRRRKLLRYLSQNKPEKYQDLIQQLGLRK